MPHNAVHNARMQHRDRQLRALIVPAAAAAQYGGQLASRAYSALPSFSGPGAVTRAIRATHEPKNIDVDANAAITLSATATPFTVLLNPTIQGTTGSTRTGRQFQMSHLRLSVSLVMGADDFDQVRVLVVEDKESRGAAPAIADVLQFNAQGLDQINTAYDFDNVPTRFKVYVDRIVCLNALAAANNPATAHFVQEVPLKSMVHCYGTGTAGTIADIDKGAVYMFVIGVQTATPTFLQYNSRITFRDI
jgi:hypothetical protein